MAWSVPCPDCGEPNESDGSGKFHCSQCGRFYGAPQPRGASNPSLQPVRATSEIESRLKGLGIEYTPIADDMVEVQRTLGPQTVRATIDAQGMIRIRAASGVEDVILEDLLGSRFPFDPSWTERYDFDLTLDDKTFALLQEVRGATARPTPKPPPPPVLGLNKAAPPPPPPPAAIEDDVVPPARDAVTIIGAAGPGMGGGKAPPAPLRPTMEHPAYSAVTHPSISMEDLLAEDETSSVEPTRRVKAPEEVQGATVETPLLPDLFRDAPRPSHGLLGVESEEHAAQPEAPGPVAAPPVTEKPAVIVFNPPAAPPKLEPAPPKLEPAPPEALRPRPPPEPLLSHRVKPPQLAPEPAEPREPEVIGPAPRPAPQPPAARVEPPPVLPLRDRDDLQATQKVATLFRSSLPPPPKRTRRAGLSTSLLLGAVMGLTMGAFVSPQSVPQLAEHIPAPMTEVRAANDLARRGELKEAIAHYQQVLARHPDLAVAWRNLGVAYALEGDAVKSAEAYRAFLRLSPSGEQAERVRQLLGEMGAQQ